MTVERDLIEDAMNAAGLEEDALQEKYSGRGTNDTCIAIVGDLRDFARFVIEFASESYGDIDWLANVRVDNLGLAQVFYWPGVTIEEDE